MCAVAVLLYLRNLCRYSLCMWVCRRVSMCILSVCTKFCVQMFNIVGGMWVCCGRLCGVGAML